MLVEFIANIAPNTRVIVHRDRDFLTEAEAQIIVDRIESVGAICFITEGSDIESYFIGAHHLGELLEEDPAVVDVWLNELAQEIHNDLSLTFGRKREAIKQLLYKKNPNFPDTGKLMGKKIPLPEKNRKGKDMLKVIRADMHARFGKTVDVKQGSKYLWSEPLSKMLIN